MGITSAWREYDSDYRELRGEGYIASFTDSTFFVNRCPTEAFVGVSEERERRYIPSVARIWDNSRFEKNVHGVYILFFNYEGVLLGGEEGVGHIAF